MRPIRTLLFSTLYPSQARPGHGIFVETRLRELLRRGGVETRVVAPVPWFPSTAGRFGRYAVMAATPERETRFGIDVLHPRWLALPRVGMTAAPMLLAAGALGAARRLLAEGFDFDLIDAHYAYPDGVAAALVARRLGKPLVITARGSDLNLIAQEHVFARGWIRWALRQASAAIGVSQALAERLRALGAGADRVHVWRNGVDLERFRPRAREAARAAIAFHGAPLLLSVGHLVDLKGHDLALDALAELAGSHPRATLAIVGDGPLRERLRQRAAALGLSDRVRFAGAIEQSALVDWYCAADLLVLASSREGAPNVVLEAMACGTPVVAMHVGGVPELVQGDAGVLIRERSGTAIASAVRQLLAARPGTAAVRAQAERHGWEPTSRAQFELFAQLAAATAVPAHA